MPNATKAAPRDPTRLAAWLARNAVDSLPQGALARRLEQVHKEGRPLRVKLGIDPTAPDIHLGHAVVLRKLREFQDAGHRVVLIIGDYTGRVGDPSGRSSLRPMLSGEQIDANGLTFQEQALRILDADPERLEIRHNGEWLDMPMVDLLALVRTTTVAQLLERDDFAKRFAANEPISLLELLYPPLQGYDSVAIDADVELGGTDQKFNLLLGRDVQRSYGKPEQSILTMPLLVGIDCSGLP
jgi:tyrosyl-tRNA synthetase